MYMYISIDDMIIIIVGTIIKSTYDIRKLFLHSRILILLLPILRNFEKNRN